MTKPKKANGHAPDFLAAAMARHRQVPVELPAGMNITAFVRTLSAAESRRITQACVREGRQITDDDAIDNERLERALLAAALVDEKGHRLIPEGREDELADLPQEIMTPVNQAYNRLQGFAAAPGN